MESIFTLADLRRAVEALPPGSSVTLPREALLQALGDGAAPAVPDAPDRRQGGSRALGGDAPRGAAGGPCAEPSRRRHRDRAFWRLAAQEPIV